MNAHKQALSAFGKVKINEPMAKHTTFKIGGPASYYVQIPTIDQLVGALDYVRGQGLPYLLLGGGSNMLVQDEGFDGVVLVPQDKTITFDGTMVTAAAGVLTVALARETMTHACAGFEWGVGVPGTIGGAVRGNAGAMGGEMKDSVFSVEVYRDAERLSLSAKECDFGYRDSAFKHNHDVILSVTLALKTATDNNAMKKAISYLQYRNSTQPQGYASTGCIFKNVDIADNTANRDALLEHVSKDDEKVQQFLAVGKISAGWLVEQVGMKGVQYGQAIVSERHGNFIVNLGNASANDVHNLIAEIKTRVYDRYGIELHEEVAMIT